MNNPDDKESEEVSPQSSNMMFNMILHYNFMLNDFSSSVDTTKRHSLIAKLKETLVGNKNAILTKRALISI